MRFRGETSCPLINKILITIFISGLAELAELSRTPLVFWPAVSESWGRPFFKNTKMPLRLSRLLSFSTTTSWRSKAQKVTSMHPIWDEKVSQAICFPGFGNMKVTFKTWATWTCWQGTDPEPSLPEINVTRLQESSWLMTVPHGNFTVPFEVSDQKKEFRANPT